MVAPSRTAAHDPKKPQRNPLSRYSPTRVNEHTKWRFLRKHRAELIRRVGGSASERQALAIEMLAKSEWTLFIAEYDADQATDPHARGQALRIANDARKQVLLWTRELTAATPPLAPAEPPGAALDRHIANLRRGSDAA
jgi:hypothetical protein